MIQKITEEEARRNWCRHGFQMEGRHGQIAANRGSAGVPLTHCLGSNCMAWAWWDGEHLCNKAERKGFCGAE